MRGQYYDYNNRNIGPSHFFSLTPVLVLGSVAVVAADLEETVAAAGAATASHLHNATAAIIAERSFTSCRLQGRAVRSPAGSLVPGAG